MITTQDEGLMKTSKKTWLVWGLISIVSFAALILSQQAKNPLIQVLGSALLFVPIFAGIAFSKNQHKP
jgi:bacteriorhodopsin